MDTVREVYFADPASVRPAIKVLGWDGVREGYLRGVHFADSASGRLAWKVLVWRVFAGSARTTSVRSVHFGRIRAPRRDRSAARAVPTRRADP